MYLRITVYLACARLKYPRMCPLRKTQQIHRPIYASLGSLDRIVLIVRWARRACKIIYPVSLHIQRLCNIMSHKFEVRIIHKMPYIVLASRKQIVDADYLVSLV